jgi:hypothetical protein
MYIIGELRMSPRCLDQLGSDRAVVRTEGSNS